MSPQQNEPDITTFLRHLPKAELHLHLEGTITPETLVYLSRRHDAEPLTLPAARALYSYTDFTHFLRMFGFVSARLATPDDYAFITHEMIRDLAAQGVVHAEVYISWGNILHTPRPQLSIPAVMEAVERAREAAEAEFGVSVLWIVDATRQFGVEEAQIAFRLAAQLREKYPSIVGIGIGGDEARGPSSGFLDAYAEARAAGLRLTAHAGESTGSLGGPAEIKAAVGIGAERIGHALAAQHDEELMKVLAEAQVPLELCVTSNLRTQCCHSIEEHPVRKYFDAGLMVTLNSDDPPMFGTDLLSDYVVVQREFGFELGEMAEFARNSFRASFLPEGRKAEMLNQIDAYCERTLG